MKTIFEPSDKTCPICGGQVGQVRKETENSTSYFYGCPRCDETLYTLELRAVCGELDKEIREGTEIKAYEPPTPSGWGEVERIFRKTQKGWEYQCYSDSELTDSDTADSLYQLLAKWHNPWPAIEVISKWVIYQRTGKKAISVTEKIFGKSIMQPIYEK